MKLFLFIILILNFVQASEVFIFTSYYDGLGEKMRVEEASAFISCKESKLAKKIYLDSKNELREIALMGKDGEWIFAGSDNNPELKRKVDLVFAGGSKKDHPCLTNPAPSSKASEQ